MQAHAEDPMTEPISYRQEAARAEIEIGKIPSRLWKHETIQPILQGLSTDALRHLACQHFMFAGIFTAGRQLADWAWAEFKSRP